MSNAAAENHPETAVYDPPPGLDTALAVVPLADASKKPARVGYLTNYSFHIWYQIVIEVMKRRGSQYGIELDILDAGLSVENQIAQAREMVSRVDAIVLTPANTSGLEEILKIAADANVPVVVEANPVEGMATMVAICDYDAGFDLGVWVGNNVKNADGSPLRILDVGLPWLRPCLLRSEGFIDGVRSIQPNAIVTASINGEATPSIARKIAADTLAEKGDVDVIFAMDDETAQGAYKGYLDVGFAPNTVTIAGFGLSGVHEKEWMMRREALKVSQAMFPEYVGLRCIDAVVRLFDGQPVSERDITPTVSMTVDNLEKFYPKKDGVWTPDFAAIAGIKTKGDCTKV
ncbi:MAG TPA: sugar ABC transporter substrate-binding protein [Pyrinomonadaceae bacterium]|jgi:ribose transport system substrate-binding protein|nr:sugar ABC transporter substrate-binding protein [Pyrinomonadaceae bacterium]